jgi:cation transport regulator ChaC
MEPIGILAYGSLVWDPGRELGPLIRERIGVTSPFSVEFARSSSSRDGAPTLVRVDTGGAPVRGVILVLDSTVDVARAKDFLWRREKRNQCSDKRYSPRAKPGPNDVVPELLPTSLGGVETVLYTRIGANIDNRTPEHLADLAICSARGKASAERKDGISYLICAKKHGIRTPLMQDYEAAILRKAKAQTLDEAYDKIAHPVSGPSY